MTKGTGFMGKHTEAAMLAARLVGLIALFTGAAVLFGSPSVERTAVFGLIILVAVVGLYVFMGTSGVISFGHVSFMAIGAYATTILTMSPVQKEVQLEGLPTFLQNMEISVVIATLIGGVLAAIFGLILAAPLMRLSGLAAGLATFSVLIIVREVIRNSGEVTRGAQGISGVPTDIINMPGVALLCAAGAIIIASFYQSSSSGLRLRASREDEVASRAIGVRVMRERTIAFVISAFITGIAGGLYAQYLGTFGPDAFYLSLTFLVIAMLVIGGMMSLSGAVLGTLVVTILSEVLRKTEESGISLGGLIDTGALRGLRDIGIAIVTLVILMMRPDGLTNGFEFGSSTFSRLRRKLKRGGEGNEEATPAKTDADEAGTGSQSART